MWFHALGKYWHNEHFSCASCQRQISNQWYDHDGKPYCMEDFGKLFAKQCSFCHQAIFDKYTTALGKHWHPDHFVCTHCRKPIGENFHEHGGKPYCVTHHLELFCPKCAYCNKPITAGSIDALEKSWHQDCLVCVVCHQSLLKGSITAKGNCIV